MGARSVTLFRPGLRLTLGAVFLVGVMLGLSPWLGCATSGPNYVPPLPPVPDISGPPLMAKHDGGARG